MENKIFMFFDRVSQTFIGNMMLLKNEQVARRTLKVFINDSQFPYANFKEDLQVFSLGNIDLNTGFIKGSPIFICNCVDLLSDSVSEPRSSDDLPGVVSGKGPTATPSTIKNPKKEGANYG